MNADSFLAARDFLLAHRTDYAAAYAGFRWPEAGPFNWALDYFDKLSAGPALQVVDDESNITLTFAQLSERSNRVAKFMRYAGVRRGDRVLVLLPSIVPLWEITLALMKLGAVLCPATPMLSQIDIQDRVERGGIRHVVTDLAGADKFADVSGIASRILVGGERDGWLSYALTEAASPEFVPDGPTQPDDPLLLYFTSGTTAKPKMVLHTHRSYPIGHLSTMYWIGLRPGDLHCNISSPGWAKQAWSSFFAPWNAGATIFVYNQPRFDAKKMLAALAQHGVTTLCAPPTVWRLFILEDLSAYPVQFRELVSAGEPLNPEVIERVQKAWGLTIRDGYGQTETTALIGNSPGQVVKAGSMGRPLPGYRLALLDAEGKDAAEGELVIDRTKAPAGLMVGYQTSEVLETSEVLPADWYRTSDVARRDADGYYWYVGRADDVFKSSDYRISPFEIESALLEHDAVAEAAVVPSPDAVRLCVPKAFVVLKPGAAPTAQTAQSIFQFLRKRLAPDQRVRRLEFAELPKTASGKIRRVELRQRELQRGDQERLPGEFRDE